MVIELVSLVVGVTSIFLLGEYLNKVKKEPIMSKTYERKDKLGTQIEIGDIVVQPTKSGGARVNQVHKVVGYTPKGIKYVMYDLSSKAEGTYAATTINYQQCVVITKLLP